MSNYPVLPPILPPDDDDERVLDADADDDLINSADADRLAAEGKERDGE